MKVLQIFVLFIALTVFINGQTNNKSILSGNVYDANGALIVGAKVIAVNQKGEKFVTITNDEGIYALNLPFNNYELKKSSNDFSISKYEIIVEAEHFEKYTLKDFKFVPSSKGKMNLDFALDIFVYIDKITPNSNN